MPGFIDMLKVMKHMTHENIQFCLTIKSPALRQSLTHESSNILFDWRVNEGDGNGQLTLNCIKGTVWIGWLKEVLSKEVLIVRAYDD